MLVGNAGMKTQLLVQLCVQGQAPTLPPRRQPLKWQRLGLSGPRGTEAASRK